MAGSVYPFEEGTYQEGHQAADPEKALQMLAWLTQKMIYDPMLAPYNATKGYLESVEKRDPAGGALAVADLLTSLPGEGQIGQIVKEGAGNLLGKDAVEQLVPFLGMLAGKNATGWGKALKAGETFLGKYDQMPRFEISDKAAQVMKDWRNKSLEAGGGRSFAWPISDVLQHDELFAQYPQMRNLTVTFDKNLKGIGGYDSGARSILINPDRIGQYMEKYAVGEDRAVRDIMLHELQHGVQDVEGFAKGATGDSKDLLEVLRRAREKLSAESPEYKNMIDQYERGEINTKSPEYQQMSAKLDEFLTDAYGKDFDKFLYERSAGELEARDTVSRADYDDILRKVVPAYSSADVSPQDAFVLLPEPTTVPWSK